MKCKRIWEQEHGPHSSGNYKPALTGCAEGLVLDSCFQVYQIYFSCISLAPYRKAKILELYRDILEPNFQEWDFNELWFRSPHRWKMMKPEMMSSFGQSNSVMSQSWFKVINSSIQNVGQTLNSVNNHYSKPLAKYTFKVFLQCWQRFYYRVFDIEATKMFGHAASSMENAGNLNYYKIELDI